MNEDELRAALREGSDDDVPSPDELVAAVRGRRAQRRVRALSVAAAVVVVAGAAVGGAALAGGGGGGGRQAAAPTPSAIAEPTTASGTGSTSSVACPAANTPRATPGVLLSGPQAAGPMFAAPVRSLLVCLYTSTSSPTSTVLTGATATAVAHSIETASTTKAAIMCPLVRSADLRKLVIIPTATDGRVLDAVTSDVSVPNCNNPITNRTAVRWNWQPPASLTALIAGTRTGGGGGGVDGDTSGSASSAPGSAPAGGASGSSGASGVVRLPVRPTGVDGAPAR